MHKLFWRPLTYITSVMTFALILSCRSNAERNFNNPVDPKKSGAPSEQPGANPAQQSGGSATCLTDCNPSANLTFSFNTPNDTGISGCSVSSSRSFDTGAELIVFNNANCGTRNQVYAQKFSYLGKPLDSPIQVSNCAFGSDGVVEFSAARGSSSSLASFTCKDSATSYPTKIVSVTESNMSLGAITTYDTLSSSPHAGLLALSWNPVGAAFAYVRTNLFQRFTTTGQSLGGAVTLNHYPLGFVTQLVNGSWYVFSSSSNTLSENGLCTKISSFGNLNCNAVQSHFDSQYGSHNITFVASLTNSSVLSSIRESGASGWFSHHAAISFSQSDCKMLKGPDTQSPNESIKDNANFLEIDSKRSAVLYRSTANRAVLSVVTDNRFATETVIANGDESLGSIEAKIISNKIFVFYTTNGKSYFASSNENAI